MAPQRPASPQPKIPVSSYLPEGIVLTPASDRFTIDEKTGVGIGNHPDTTPEQKVQLAELIHKYDKIFATSMDDLREPYSGDAGSLQIVQSSNKRAFCRPKHHGRLKDAIADKFYSELERVGIIEPAPHSRSACNTTFAQKRAADGTMSDLRICINYAPQNDLSEAQNTHFPLAEDLFQQIGKSRWLSKLDMRSGFFQIPVHPDSKDLTAFWWGTNLYRYTRMPFGLKQCPAAYQRVMDVTFAQAGLTGCTKVFIDDVLVHSDTFEQHLKDLESVFQCLAAVNLKVHPGKSHCGIDTI